MKKSFFTDRPYIQYIVYLFLLLVFIFGCTVQKDRRAINRVEANINLLNQTGVEWLKLHPCANESTILILRDTVTENKTDTVHIAGVPDTIKIKTVQTIYATKTIEKTVIDGQMVKMQADTINAQKRAISFQAGQLSAKDQTIKEQKKSNLYLWLTICGFICSIVIYFGIGWYIKIHKVV